MHKVSDRVLNTFLVFKTDLLQLQWLKKFVDGIFADTGDSVPVTERIVSFNTNYIRDAYKMFYNLSEK